MAQERSKRAQDRTRAFQHVSNMASRQPTRVSRRPKCSQKDSHEALRRRNKYCLLYTSDAADDTPCVDL
eukprot:8789942-Pyramimonas_sp.AAC.1